MTAVATIPYSKSQNNLSLEKKQAGDKQSERAKRDRRDANT